MNLKYFRFFPPEATDEILSRVLPLFNANSAGDAFTVQAYLVRFLPTAPSSKSSPSKWLPTIFSFWYLIPGSLMYQIEFIDLVARVAEDNVGVEVNNPDQIGIFTQAQVKTVFATGQKMMDLPNRQRYALKEKGEHKPECKTSESRRLTPDLKRQFVLILRGVTFLSMFGKDPLSVGSSQAALKYLACYALNFFAGLEPSLIFPGLLGRVYPSLETLTEVALSLLAIPLFSRAHYPAGGKHLAPLLHLTIPGIDMNDPIKTISSLIFLTHAVMGVPLRDLTEGSSITESEFRWEGMDIDEREEDRMETNVEEEDALCKASTAVFEEWLAKFLRQRGKMSMQSMETGLVTVLLHACEIVGTQMSEQLQDMALKMFIPLCRTNIIIELQHGASSTPTTSPTHHIQSDATLHWYQCILYHVIMLSGSELLRHKNDLLYLAKEMVQKCRSRKGYMWTGKFIRMMLVALTQIYPLECRSVDKERWNSEEYQKNQHKHWVQPGDPENINVDWHVPSNPELDFAMEILEIFLLPTLKRIQDLMNSGTDEEGKVLSNREMTHEFCRRLSIVRNCVGGMTTLVEDDDCETEAVLPIKSIPVGYCFLDPNDPRRQTARRLRKELEKSKYDASKRGYQYAKGMLKTSNHDKKYPPSPEMAEFAAKGLVSELPALRRIAISTTTRILFHIKQRTLTNGDLELIALEKANNPLKKTITIPRPLPEGYTNEYLTTCLTKLSSQAAFNKFLERFNSSTFWSSLLSYLSQEFVRDREDNFSMINAHLFKSIFQMYEDTFLEVAKPEIAKLCESAEKNQQRAASEILADPRRVLPLINLVLDSKLDPTSHASFAEAKKLFFVNTLINTFSWRVIPRSQSLFDIYFSNIRHPYKQVRDVMAANINVLLQMQWHPSASSVSEIIEFNCKTGEGVGYVPVTLAGNLNNTITELVQSLTTWQAERKPTAAGSSEYGNA
ncbi:650_t:CDS:10, partial [Racocetra fulgida]